ncbi:MAG TPA: branched-chain amino acid ABC transporter permease [Terriglobales bacterium]
MDYAFHLIVLISIYAILAVSLDLLVGQTGLVSISQAAFYAAGAYIGAILAVGLRAPFLIEVLAAMLGAALISLLVSIPSIHLRGDYFFIATFAFQLVVTSLLNNWVTVTRGPLGLAGISPVILFGVRIESSGKFAILAVAATAISYVIVWRVVRSPFGRVMRAIREDELFAQSLGKNTQGMKVIVVALSAAFAAVGGCLYAHYMTYIDPTNFTFTESLLILSMVVIGGAGSLIGPFVGAGVLVLLPEVLRLIGLPSNTAANIRQLFYGGLLVTLMFLRPRGFFGKYGFGRKT